MWKNLPSNKINITKNALFFLSRAPTHHSFTFNSQFLYELKRQVHLPSTVCGVSIFDTVLLSLCFCSTKSNGSLTLKRHNFFQNKTNGKATCSFTPSLLIFKLQQKVWKFNDICLSWSSPETDLETNF